MAVANSSFFILRLLFLLIFTPSYLLHFRVCPLRRYRRLVRAKVNITSETLALGHKASFSILYIGLSPEVRRLRGIIVYTAPLCWRHGGWLVHDVNESLPL